MNKFTIIHQDDNPEVLVMTPLAPGHKISKETKKTIKRNNIKFVWVSSEGPNNIPTNAKLGLEWIKKKIPLPPYYIMIDRDIILGRHMLDKMARTLAQSLSISSQKIGYTYANFEFKGHINRSFPAQPFNIQALLQHNYISSNSMFLTDVLDEIGLVTDDHFQRLLDWCFLLKMYYYDYIGIPCPEASFVAQSTKDDISAGPQNDYINKRMRVVEYFIKPILEDKQNQGIPASKLEI